MAYWANMGFPSSAGKEDGFASFDHSDPSLYQEDVQSEKKLAQRRLNRKRKSYGGLTDEDDDAILMDNMVDDFQMTLAEFRELMAPQYESAFTEIVTGRVQVPKGFLSTTKQEEQEKWGLHPIKEEDPTVYCAPSAQKRFKRIDPKLQTALSRVKHSQSGMVFIAEMESYLYNFAKGQDSKCFILIDEPFHRYLCHGICTYYGLKSESIDYKKQRITLIQRPNDYHTPNMTLYTYLYGDNIDLLNPSNPLSYSVLDYDEVRNSMRAQKRQQTKKKKKVLRSKPRSIGKPRKPLKQEPVLTKRELMLQGVLKTLN